MTFTHLQIQSGYSFYHSTVKIKQLIEKAESLQIQALTLADENVLYGAIEFFKSCKAHDIKPIIGMTTYITIKENVQLPFVLLAKGNDGYRNLLLLSTEIQMHSSLNLDFVRQYSNDLICIIPSSTPWINEKLLKQDFELLHTVVQPLQEMFDSKTLYFGVEIYQRHEHHSMIEASRNYQAYSNIEMVALQNVRYLEEGDATSLDCLQAIGAGRKWSYSERNLVTSHHFRSKEETEEVFSSWPQLIENISNIIDRCNVCFHFEQQLLPAFPIPIEGLSASQYLKQLCEVNISSRYRSVTKEVDNRLQYELEIIDRLGFSDYFLIVADFVQYAKRNGIIVGPGRGSAAGSLVAYLLHITNVDPLKHDLLFERFLNPERVTMPDIDIDFSDVRREEVIDYVREKYGQDHVAHIITFGTFAARSLLRELMKAMDIDYRDQAYILKHVPVQSSESLLQSVQASDHFQSYIKQSSTLRILFSIALKLEGLPRHISTHAAGIVIGKEPLIQNVPLTLGTHHTFLTQYPMNDLEAIGLLKIDILGLKNLSLMERIIQSIAFKAKRPLDLDLIPDQDPKTFQLLQKGKTNGIFQLESSGMKQVLTSLKPTSLNDIIALNALYRPGPMEQIPTYINRKHERESVKYLHPKLEPILQSTYGVLLYQEQIMQIAHQFAGLSLSQADILRRAISKKNKQLIEEQRDTFIKGCLKQGYDKAIAKELFSWIFKFANYGFNKSHSVAYSKIAYQLSYLKAHYPTYFFAQLFGNAINDSHKLNLYVREINELGINLMPPSINKSYAYFTVENNNIRTGLMAIKGIGYEAVKAIIEHRKNKKYKNLFDFCLRVKIKRSSLETLILAGAFDETNSNRASLLASIDQAYLRAELFGDMQGQGDLFEHDLKMKPTYTEMQDFSDMQKLKDEKELLQMYVSSHPMKKYRRQLTLQHFISIEKAKMVQQHRKLKMIVILQDVKKIHTKRGDSMAFIMMSDETAEMEGVIFPPLYREVNPTLHEETVMYIEGKISVRDQKKQLIIDRLYPVQMEEIVHEKNRCVYIKLTKDKQNEVVLQFLQEVAKKNPGALPIIIYNEEEKKSYKLEDRYNIEDDEQCMVELKEYFGIENVVITT